jgi:hypothetical protein
MLLPHDDSTIAARGEEVREGWEGETGACGGIRVNLGVKIAQVETVCVCVCARARANMRTHACFSVQACLSHPYLSYAHARVLFCV